jgi:hypothetical protein
VIHAECGNSHDNQIEALITVAEKHEEAIEDLYRHWQAYLNTQPITEAWGAYFSVLPESAKTVFDMLLTTFASFRAVS